jgi:alpha-L-rhamnosidase
MATDALHLAALTCEYHTNPLGLDVPQPRLSWKLVAADALARNLRQSAYQVLVAGDEAALEAERGDVWDSGRVESAESTLRAYGGPALSSGQRCYWKVRVWDGAGQPSAWSETAWWEMGLLSPSDWQAQWIAPGFEEDLSDSTPSPLLRGTFAVDGQVRSARAYVTAHGLYALELNGRPVSEDLLTPGWTSYHHRLQYQTYDVTALLQTGANALGAALGDGWYRGYFNWHNARQHYGQTLALLAQVVITYADGRVQVVGTSGDWQSATGPIRRSDIYHGEDYDARLERPGWSTVGYDTAGWAGVTVEDHGYANLVAPNGPPVRRMETVRPLGQFVTPAGELVVDMGQNMVGWVRLTLPANGGRAGDVVTLRFAEVLDQAGNLYVANLRSARQTDRYTLKGEGEAVFEPHFTFHGFRYVHVAGYPGELSLDDLTGVVVYSAMTPTGEFECSDPLLNQLQHNIQWGQKGNFVDVPTDCPQRDERLGWTGDAQVFSRTAAFNFDVAGFMTKWLRDLAADQTPEGRVPHVVPDILKQGGSTGWGDAAVIVPWHMYQCYGDARPLAEQYPSMVKWIEYGRAQTGGTWIWSGGVHFGDWLAVPPADPNLPYPVTDMPLISTAYLAYSISLVQKAARVLGYADDAAEYARWLAEVKAAFRNEFVTPNGRLSPSTQTAYVMALYFDLLPEALRAQAAARLVEDIRKRDNHLLTGFLGTSYLPHVLSDNGYLDVAYALLNQKTYPSWLYPVTQGATTIWERWDGIRPDGTFQAVTMNSFNHYAYGAIGDWMYRVVAGVRLDPADPGYHHSVIRPQPGGGLTYARAAVESLYGRVESGWRQTEGGLEVNVTIPPNTTADVYLPAADVAAVTLDGAPVKGDGVRAEAGQVVVRLGSGSYAFNVKDA